MTASTSVIQGNSFIGNQAQHDSGGAVYGLRSTLLLQDNSFTSNYASAGGGAIVLGYCAIHVRGYNMF